MKEVILEIIGSYEKRIDSVSEIIEGSRDLIESYKEQRKIAMVELQSNLAHAESLRKKDFDRMMDKILSRHKEREEEVKMMLHKYVENHRSMAKELRTLFGENKNKRYHEEQKRLLQFRMKLEQIKKEQEEREKEVRKILGRFQNEQDNFTEVINKLLSKGKDIRTQEVKFAVQNLSPGNVTKKQSRVNFKKKENHYVSR